MFRVKWHVQNLLEAAPPKSDILSVVKIVTKVPKVPTYWSPQEQHKLTTQRMPPAINYATTPFVSWLAQEVGH